MKILFFIEDLQSGGKERRLVELLTYLKSRPDYELLVILMRKEIHYNQFVELKIPYIVLGRKFFKKDPILFFTFYQVCKKFAPDIIHTWSSMVAFYSLPTIVFQKISLINSQITDAPPRIKKWSFDNFISQINFKFSTLILANSKAGLESYGIGNSKSKVIYNGVNLIRFKNIKNKKEINQQYKICTTYSVAMVATFSNNKDYDLFIETAKSLNAIRKDVTFIAAGSGKNLERIKNRVIDEQICNVIFTGKINNVESLVDLTDIGVLFSNKLVHGEGISNSITEYMALGKPVIANDAGGTKEIVKQDMNGFLITNETPEEIAYLINNLINNTGKLKEMGEAGRKLIESTFTIEKMGEEFEKVYKNAMSKV